MSNPFASQTLEELQEELRRVQAGEAPQYAPPPPTPGPEGVSGVGPGGRLRSSFGSNEAERMELLRASGYEPTHLPSGELGVLKDGKTYPIDVSPGQNLDRAGRMTTQDIGQSIRDLPGDIMDLGGDVAPTVLGTLGSIAGSLTAHPLVGGVVGGATGSGAGEVVSQSIGRALGSGQTEYNIPEIGAEAAYGGIGDAIAYPLGRFLKGPFGRSATEEAAPQVNNAVRQMREIDTRLNTNLEGLAPADVQTGSDMLGHATQRIRESGGGGQALREGQDIPFQREVSNALDETFRQTGSPDPEGFAGPFAERAASRGQAGRDLRGAAEATLTERRAEQKALYRKFEDLIDPNAAPDLTNTQQAIAEIKQGDSYADFVAGKKTGLEGFDQVMAAIEESASLPTFRSLRSQARRMGSKIKQFDRLTMSDDSDRLLKQLRAALRADEDAFLTSGGVQEGAEIMGLQTVENVGARPGAAEAGQKARDFTRAMHGVDEASSVRRVFRDELKAGNIPEMMRGMNSDEIMAVRQAVGIESVKGEAGETILHANKQGREAFEKMVAEVLDDNASKSKDVKLSTNDPVHTVYSGARMKSELAHYDHGRLEALVGEETAADLRKFSEMLFNTTTSERNFANFPGTAKATAWYQDMGELFTRPAAGAGKIVGRMLGEWGLGRTLGSQGGKNFLLGKAAFQQGDRGLIRTLGALGGQAGTRYGANELGIRR